MRKKASELTDAQRRGRNNKSRGSSTERALVKLLLSAGIEAKRVVLSGALKKYAKVLAGNADNYRGDIAMKIGNVNVRIEVKSRTSLPSYVTNVYIDRTTHEVKQRSPDECVVKIKGLCHILTWQQLQTFLHTGDLPEGKTINKKCKVLEDWFHEDDAQIVAMKEKGRRTWYFAVKLNAAYKIGGKI